MARDFPELTTAIDIYNWLSPQAKQELHDWEREIHNGNTNLARFGTTDWPGWTRYEPEFYRQLKNGSHQITNADPAVFPPVPLSPTKPRIGFVYLMIDHRSGYYKIGWSKNPQVRETTLQAEMPLIELVNKWPGTTFHERELHLFFSGQRLRGEWFNLSPLDVQTIEQFLTREQHVNYS